jgi:superfamily I DNA/RNA helicase
MTPQPSDVEKRQEYVDRLVQSPARLKIVVAGPGTGKSYAFRKVLAALPDGDRIALSFINNLVHDLQKDLAGLADSKTFHAYCRGLLHRRASDGLTTEFHYFPPLEQLVATDAALLGRSDLPNHNFSQALHTLEEGDGRITFFLERSSYYNAVGFDDSVYRVLKTFEADATRVPALSYLIVDEFQDFNRLEVSFLLHLERTTPTLIAGDDDQAIYQSLRHAKPDFIRDKHNDGAHERFELPYCSRCTRVLVEATNAFVQRAQAHGLLTDRIPKQFLPFSGKDADSAAFPKLVSVKCSVDTVTSPQIGAYIAHEIKAIRQDTRDEAGNPDTGFPLALILGPGQYLKRINTVLKDRIPNLRYKEKRELCFDSLDGYRALLKHAEGNLGWRILLECLNHRHLKKVLKTAYDAGAPLHEALPAAFIAEHTGLLEALRRAVADEGAVSDQEWQTLEATLGFPKDTILARLKAEDTRDKDDAHPERNGSVILTSYSGAKGLSAATVFIVGMEQSALPKSNQRPTDEEVNQFVVALTRARKQCHLIHAGQFMGQRQMRSVFVDWLPPGLLESRLVNADLLHRWERESSTS